MATSTSGCAFGCAQSIGTFTLAQLVVGACGYKRLTAASNEQTDQVIGWSRYRCGMDGAGGSTGPLAGRAAVAELTASCGTKSATAKAIAIFCGLRTTAPVVRAGLQESSNVSRTGGR